MQTKRERDVIKRITQQYGQVIDLKKTPGVMIEILRDFGPNILKVLEGGDGSGGGGGGPSVSSMAIVGPGKGAVRMEDWVRVVVVDREVGVKVVQIVGRPGRSV